MSQAITRLLRASTAPLYKGSILKMLEITYQGQSTDIGTKLLLLSPHDVTGELLNSAYVLPRTEAFAVAQLDNSGHAGRCRHQGPAVKTWQHFPVRLS